MSRSDEASFSIVVDTTLWSPDLARAFAETWLSLPGFKIDAIITIASDSTSMEAFDELHAAGYTVIEAPGEVTHANAINIAAASASTERILIIDEFLLPPRELSPDLARSIGPFHDAAVSLEIRETGAVRLSTYLTDLETEGSRYLRSVPRSHLNRNNALILQKDLFMRLRGYDEALPLDGDPSIDFLLRIARSGITIDETSSPLACVYSPKGDDWTGAAWNGVEGQGTISTRLNRLNENHSIYRNLTNWSVPNALRRPLVSVCIATYNRKEYLADAINSVRMQTFQDFEIVIVDDGSPERADDVIESIGDPRVKYFWQERGGISAARNRAADEAVGYLTAVHDDDDIMVPWRLEEGIKALSSGVSASYGSWVNFSNDNAAMKLHVIRRDFNPELNAYNGQGPGHATWTLPTHYIRKARYNTEFSSAVDHNLASRLAWSGLTWKHTETVMFLRRMHSTQVSELDSGRQRSTAVLTRFANAFSVTGEAYRALSSAGQAHTNPVISESKALGEAFAKFLPDHLVRRTMVVTNRVSNHVMAIEMSSRIDSLVAELDRKTGRLRLERANLVPLTLHDLAALRQLGVTEWDIRASASNDHDSEDPALDSRSAEDLLFERLEELNRSLGGNTTSHSWLLVNKDVPEASLESVTSAADKACEISAFTSPTGESHVRAFGFRDALVARKWFASLTLDANAYEYDPAQLVSLGSFDPPELVSYIASQEAAR